MRGIYERIFITMQTKATSRNTTKRRSAKGEIMSFSFFNQGFIPSDSYSRQLDKRVAMDEFPYGYDSGEPPYNHHNTGFLDEHYKSPTIENEQKTIWPNRNKKQPKYD